jgi:cytochrome P450
MAVVETLEDRFAEFVSALPEDPRPFYAELREHAPVLRTPFGFWYVTRYDLAQAVIRNDAAWSVSSVLSSSAGGLGAAVARIELQLALAGILSRWEEIELAGEVRWKPSFIIRGLETLPVRLR